MFPACTTYVKRYHILSLPRAMDTNPGHNGMMECLRFRLLCAGCGLHDVHRGFFRRTSRYCGGSEMIDDLFIVIESLCNGHKPLQSRLRSFWWYLWYWDFDHGGFSRRDLLPTRLGETGGERGCGSVQHTCAVVLR